MGDDRRTEVPQVLEAALRLPEIRADVNRILKLHGEALLGAGYREVSRIDPSIRPRRARQVAAWVAREGLRPMPIEEPPDPPKARDLPPISRWDSVPTPPPTIAAPDFERIPIPEDAASEVDIDALIARQLGAFERKRAKMATLGPRQIKMPAGPFAIVHFGDPHVDDDGCDWPALQRAVRTCSSTPGMYAGNIGDTVNNWVGRLVALYAEQQATDVDAWELARWLIRSVPWLYIVLGNHDLWNRGARIVQGLTEGTRIGLMAPDEVRLELLCPGAEPVKLHARHDFPGHSMWNSLHGLTRAGKLDGWADLYVAGHRHIWATSRDEGADGRVRWAVRARGFKRFDSYARSKGFHEQQHGDTVTTVHDPTHRHPAERVQVYLDVEEAAEVLTWKRNRRGGR